MYICLYLDIYCLYLHVSLFISASITVSICMYSCQYLHNDSARSLFVSACFPVCICKYPCSYLHVSYPVSECVYPHGAACIPFVSERIPVHICLCPVFVCIFSLMHILQIIDPAGQPNYNTHRHIHNHSRTHIHCAVFFLRLCISVGALSVQRLQQPVLEWLQDRACCFTDLKSVVYLQRAKPAICLHHRLIGRENHCHHFDERQRSHNEISKRKISPFLIKLFRWNFQCAQMYKLMMSLSQLNQIY